LHPANVAGTLRRMAGRWAHVAAFHAVRSPWYAVRLVGYAVLGLLRVAGNQVAWWWVRDHFTLMQSAAAAGERMEWARLHREIKATRLWRGTVLTAEAIAVTVGVLFVRAGLVPPLVLAAGGAVVLVVLARYGRPAGRTLIGTATYAPPVPEAEQRHRAARLLRRRPRPPRPARPAGQFRVADGPRRRRVAGPGRPAVRQGDSTTRPRPGERLRRGWT